MAWNVIGNIEYVFYFSVSKVSLRATPLPPFKLIVSMHSDVVSMHSNVVSMHSDVVSMHSNVVSMLPGGLLEL